MFRVNVITARADAWGVLPDGNYTFPSCDEVPTYSEVREWLIEERIKERIKAISVRHIFKGRITHILDNEKGDIVPVNEYLNAFNL